MRITLFSLINTLIISAFLILLVGLFLKNKKFYKYSNLQLIRISLIIIFIKLIFPIELPLFKVFSFTINSGTNNVQFENNIEWKKALFLIWILGVIVLGFLYFLRIIKTIRLYRIIYTSSKKGKVSDFISLYNNDYEVIFSSYIEYPCVVMGYKTIIVPMMLRQSKEMKQILQHELKHIENKDFIVKFVFDILCIIYWWFYPVYSLKRYVDLFLEMRVDYEVNRYKNEEERIEYAHSLINVSKTLISKHAYMELSNSFGKSNLEYRINYFFEEKVHKKINKVIFICLVMLSFMCNFIFVAVKEKVDNPLFTTIPNKKIELVGSLSEDDKILLFRSGAYFHGEIEIRRGLFNVERYNTETYPRAMTIKELNKRVKTE